VSIWSTGKKIRLPWFLPHCSLHRRWENLHSFFAKLFSFLPCVEITAAVPLRADKAELVLFFAQLCCAAALAPMRLVRSVMACVVTRGNRTSAKCEIWVLCFPFDYLPFLLHPTRPTLD